MIVKQEKVIEEIKKEEKDVIKQSLENAVKNLDYLKIINLNNSSKSE